MTWPSYSAFIRDRTVLDGSLCVPVRLLWREYLAYCSEWGFDPSPASDFVRWLQAEEGVRIKEGGAGRLRRMAVGVAPVTEEKTDARNA